MATGDDPRNLPVKAVMMVYDTPAFSIVALKKSGIKAPKDLEGKKLGAPVFDASFRLFPAFAKKTGIAKWEHVNLTPQLVQLLENLVEDRQGVRPVKANPGGAILYRAQGAPKGDTFKTKADEWEEF